MTPRELLDDLARVGVEIEDIWDLVNDPKPSPKAAVPVLLEWLTKLEDAVAATHRPRLREAIVRALGTPSARGQAGPILVVLFQEVSDRTGTGIRWTIGNSLGVVADPSLCQDILSLVENARYGRAREMLVRALPRICGSRAIRTLITLLSDDTVVAHAALALGRLRAVEAQEALNNVANHPNRWIRQQVEKALAEIHKAQDADAAI